MSDFFVHMDSYAGAETDSDRERIEAELWARYGTEGTVCLHDMAGFSRLTVQHGIVHYLSLIGQMRGVVGPLIEEFGGQVVKYEADNTYARFADPDSALTYALAVNAAFEARNAELAEGYGIRISTGIDHGRFLLIDDEDFFGVPVNTASKLAEDIGGGGEILVTQAAIDGLAADAPDSTTEVFEISGIRINAHRIAY